MDERQGGRQDRHKVEKKHNKKTSIKGQKEEKIRKSSSMDTRKKERNEGKRQSRQQNTWNE